MKKLINNPRDVVEEMIDGLVAGNPELTRLADFKVVIRSDYEKVRDEQVTLLSGGGSGHEPAHAGFIGPGMLTAAVLGEVFTSPDSDSILAAIRTIAGKPGVLLIVKNYTGDRLNFGLAAEMAKELGSQVEMVLVSDDVALTATHARKESRGIAGTVLVHKIAGAAAAQGLPLKEVARIARETADSLATMGVSLSSGIVPAVGTPSFQLNEDEVELGLGIHGEPGVRRASLSSANEMVDTLLDGILKVAALRERQAILLANNLGSTTPMELAVVTGHAVRSLAQRNVRIERVLSGTFMTSLEMAGVSLTLLEANDERLALFDAPASAPAWPHVPAASIADRGNRQVSLQQEQPPAATAGHDSRPLPGAAAILNAISAALLEKEPELTRLDQIAGDGDLGITMARAAAALQKAAPDVSSKGAGEMLSSIAKVLRHEMGGSSGPLYAVLLMRASQVLRERGENSAGAWADAFSAGCAALSAVGGASEGERTMLDSLLPFAKTFTQELASGGAVQAAYAKALTAADEGAAATAQMLPRRGRSGYLGERALGSPDPGAVAVVVWLKAIGRAL